MSLPNFAFFTIKSGGVTQRSVFKKMLLKRAKTCHLFYHKTIGSNNSFTLIENNFRFFKKAKFEFKVTVHYGLWLKCTQL